MLTKILGTSFLSLVAASLLAVSGFAGDDTKAASCPCPVCDYGADCGCVETGSCDCGNGCCADGCKAGEAAQPVAAVKAGDEVSCCVAKEACCVEGAACCAETSAVALVGGCPGCAGAECQAAGCDADGCCEGACGVASCGCASGCCEAGCCAE